MQFIIFIEILYVSKHVRQSAILLLCYVGFIIRNLYLSKILSECYLLFISKILITEN